MIEDTTYKYAPYLRGENEIEVAYKLGISVDTIRRLKTGGVPSYWTLKKFYDAGYPVIESFDLDN